MSASAVKTSQSTTPKKGSHYAKSSVELRRDLAKALPQELVKELHKTEPWKHFLVLGWQFLLLAVGVTGAVMVDRWLLWLPFSIVIGFTIFNFTVMLHEVVHDAVFTKKRRPFAQKALGWLYAFPSGISRSQFTRWHLDHHAELGDDEADPKRHHLSPKKHARWYKFLYMTPALIPIYFRGAKRETATYPEDLQKQIRFERAVTVVGQLAILASIVVRVEYCEHEDNLIPIRLADRPRRELLLNKIERSFGHLFSRVIARRESVSESRESVGMIEASPPTLLTSWRRFPQRQRSLTAGFDARAGAA